MGFAEEVVVVVGVGPVLLPGFHRHWALDTVEEEEEDEEESQEEEMVAHLLHRHWALVLDTVGEEAEEEEESQEEAVLVLLHWRVLDTVG